MKLTDAQRFEMLRVITPAVIALELTRAPAARDGSAKKVSPDFAAAVWSKRYLETLCSVLEKERKDLSSGGGASASGFPQ